MLILHPAITIGGLNISRAMAPVVSAALVLVFVGSAFLSVSKPEQLGVGGSIPGTAGV